MLLFLFFVENDSSIHSNSIIREKKVETRKMWALCTRSSSFNEHEEDDEETIPLSNIIAPATDVQYKVRRSSTRSCRMVSDNSFYFRTSVASQMRVDLTAQTIVPGYIPNGWRRVECSGSTLIEQKPLVFDFTDAKAMQAADTSSTISLSPSSIAKPSTSWGAVTKNAYLRLIATSFNMGAIPLGLMKFTI